MPEPPSDSESYRLLREFLETLRDLLDGVVQEPSGVIPGRHHARMRAAWEEVKPKFQLVIRELGPKIDVGKARRLKEAGLTGAQLQFKLSIFSHAHDSLLDQRRPTDPEPKAPRRRFWSRLFDRTLKAADVILGSLAAIFPPAEAIKEFKESTEAGAKLGWTLGDG